METSDTLLRLECPGGAELVESDLRGTASRPKRERRRAWWGGGAAASPDERDPSSCCKRQPSSDISQGRPSPVEAAQGRHFFLCCRTCRASRRLFLPDLGHSKE